MNANRRVLVHQDAPTVAAAAAARIITTLQDAQAERGEGTIVLTGGTLGIATLAAVAAAPALGAVDWSRVNVWWSDERFVTAGSPDRNAVQAEVLLTALDPLGLDRGRVHQMGSSDAFATPELAAADYAGQLAAEAGDSGSTVSVPAAGGPAALPVIDVLLLGMGPDSHIASLFPDHVGSTVTDAAVIGVRDSPKPPPLRVSLTFAAINTARQVWFLVSGPEKAPAVGVALGSGATRERVPASGASGTDSTLWLVAKDAAGLI